VGEQQTWAFIDKASWGHGPWSTEPDKVQWTDDATGLMCLARRGPVGAWCGYVGIAAEHPLFGVAYDKCSLGCEETWCDHRPDSLLDVHGGITYSDFCQEEDRPHGICHIPEPGQPERVWWFGFDCSHAGDLMPSFLRYGADFPIAGDDYRALSYVQAECARLAQQLRAMQND
jgi:hypothetical protein